MRTPFSTRTFQGERKKDLNQPSKRLESHCAENWYESKGKKKAQLIVLKTVIATETRARIKLILDKRN